jgi:uncharacterized protein (TIGR02466 family)
MAQQQSGRNIGTPPPLSAASAVDPKRWLAEARDHRRAGRIAAAEAVYRRVIAARPADPEPRYLLGTLCTQTGRSAEAVEHLGIASRLAPNTAPLFNHLGHALVAAGRQDDAEAAFRRAIELRPDLAEAHLNLGTLLRQSGRLADAAHSFRQAAAADPGTPHALINLGITLQEIAAFDEAVAALHQAVAIDGCSFEAYYNLGGVLAAQRRIPEAAAAYQAAIGLNAEVPWAHVNLGFVLQEMRQTAAAIACYRRAIALAPNLAQAYINLGGALHEQGDLQGSLAAVRRALELEPWNAGSQANLAQTLRELGDLAGSEAAYHRVLELEPGLPLAQAHLSILLQQLRRYDEAGVLLDYDRLLRRRVLDRVDGWPTAAAFNADLARAVYEHPTLMRDPPGKATMQGSQTLEILNSAERPLAALQREIEAAVADYMAETVAASPSLFPAPPETRRLHGWGVVLRSSGHQTAHFHPAGVVSGVYYVRIPAVVRSGEAGDAGCIKFGVPEPGHAGPQAAPTRLTTSVRPAEGLMILFPSYFWHQTIPFESTEERVCIAFDLLADPARRSS